MRNWKEYLPFPVEVNDIHSQLNATTVQRVFRPQTATDVSKILLAANRAKTTVAVSGGRHSMGGQAFLASGELLDMRNLNQISDFDGLGTVTVGAGIQWPQLVKQLEQRQPHGFEWTIRQKQTGGDRLTVGGSMASNIHSRGLTMRPMVDDIESFDLVLATGEIRHVSRSENSELFPLVIGGYGLFGVVTEVKLRLAKRKKIRRHVEVRTTEGLMDAFDNRIAHGFEYGDFQFAIDPLTEGFLRDGVFACYEPVDDKTEIPGHQKRHLAGPGIIWFGWPIPTKRKGFASTPISTNPPTGKSIGQTFTR